MATPIQPAFQQEQCLTDEIRSKAFELGWDDVGMTSAQIPEEDIQSYKEWIARGNHGNLKYMENDLRTAPDQLLPGAKTAILFISNYKQPAIEIQKHTRAIASYARGRDYHNVHRSRLKKFITWLENRTQSVGCAVGFSDSKPILEKALFVKAGLGWFGKNTLLIHRRFGTFTLLSGILTTLEISAIAPANTTRFPRCGVCTRCLDACPTKALKAPYELQADLCLSYHLIESQDNIPPHIAAKNPGYAFGCDICQNVCPHNVRSPLSECIDFSPTSGIGPYLKEELLQQSEEALYGTPLKRRGMQGLLLNYFSL